MAIKNNLYHEKICIGQIIRFPDFETRLGSVVGISLIALGLVSFVYFILSVFIFHKSQNVFVSLLLMLGFFFSGFVLLMTSIKVAKARRKKNKNFTPINVTVLNRKIIEEETSGYGWEGTQRLYVIILEYLVGDEKYFVKIKVNKRLYNKFHYGKLLNMAYSNSNPCILLMEE